MTDKNIAGDSIGRSAIAQLPFGRMPHPQL